MSQGGARNQGIAVFGLSHGEARFELAFGAEGGEADAEHPNYVVYRRDTVYLHMQFQYPHEMGTIRLRFLVEDPDALYAEYRERGVEWSGEAG
jgi:hypothetical protein